jgi:hypothetical protein
MALDFDPDVVGLSSQPFRLSWEQGGKDRAHTPDYFARLRDGTGVVLDVRDDGRIEPEDAAAFAATARACASVGWEFRRVGALAGGTSGRGLGGGGSMCPGGRRAPAGGSGR